ncbi:MAG: bifunctional tetrahydrofolate synthase/dihydrofolate synthase [Pseudomonadales bacterium]|nr:bifunctional tetrahydrofolate synthase/dihydrofolate synthase [Pseudomonadales bacterium]
MSKSKATWSLSRWLEYIQAQHPREIELGLERVEEVARRLALPLHRTRDDSLAPLIITVAGTNGKGSCVAMLAAIFQADGKRVGTYTSPHILRFNERIRIAGSDARDELICQGFARIEASRQDVSLSYFEYATLAALLLFQEASLDVLILEVGLGGRLDAVNIVTPDLTLITNIDLDHQDWLGNTRELIGREKAGILRPETPLIYGDADLPESISVHAAALQAPVYQLGKDYGFKKSLAQDSECWYWYGHDAAGQFCELPELPQPALDLCNAATVLQVLHLLADPPDRKAINTGLEQLTLAGRFQEIRDNTRRRTVLLDVAHNPHAAANLAAKLLNLKLQRSNPARPVQIHLLLAMMHDKDHKGFFDSLEKVVDFWYIAHFDQPRCQPAERLLQTLHEHALSQHSCPRFQGAFKTVGEAYQTAADKAGENDIIIACGSFVTVAEMMHLLTESAPGSELH